MRTYYITFSISNEESAQHGDYAEYGEIGQFSSLRDAVGELFNTRTSHVDGIRATGGHYATHSGRLCLSVFNGMEYLTGEEEQRSFHVHGISKASAHRIARLAGIQIENY